MKSVLSYPFIYIFEGDFLVNESGENKIKNYVKSL